MDKFPHQYIDSMNSIDKHNRTGVELIKNTPTLLRLCLLSIEFIESMYWWENLSTESAAIFIYLYLIKSNKTLSSAL